MPRRTQLTHLAVLHELLLKRRTAGLLRLELVHHARLVRLPQRLVSLPAPDVAVHAIDSDLDGLIQLQHGLDDLR